MRPARFEGNMYMPQWYRETSDGFEEGWCGLCPSGRWLHVGSIEYHHDRSVLHGISMVTGRSFPEPRETRWTITYGFEGLCARCNDWVSLKRSPSGIESWSKHSWKVRETAVSMI
ncbi:hypothetical protein GGR55DRAFT_347184 [Xylaria sp. FL0064]|nr:hypothetical protein GGR55DRAFT_347184 [Xylaria sp. FL0064]